MAKPERVLESWSRVFFLGSFEQIALVSTASVGTLAGLFINYKSKGSTALRSIFGIGFLPFYATSLMITSFGFRNDVNPFDMSLSLAIPSMLIRSKPTPITLMKTAFIAGGIGLIGGAMAKAVMIDKKIDSIDELRFIFNSKGEHDFYAMLEGKELFNEEQNMNRDNRNQN